MNFNNYNLITEKESKEAYQIQQKILNDMSENNMTESILHLSLLIGTYSLIEDFGEGAKILYDYFKESNNYKVLILGMKFSDYSCNDEIFEDLAYSFKANSEKIPPYERAMGYYLLALENGCAVDEKIKFLKKSISITEENGLKFSDNYLWMAHLIDDKNEKTFYLKKALDNIVFILDNNDKTKYYRYYGDYVSEFVTGCTSVSGYSYIYKEYNKLKSKHLYS